MRIADLQAADIVARARAGAAASAGLASAARSAALAGLADALDADVDAILDANRRDLVNAAGERPALLDRLRLTPGRIHGIADRVRAVARADDPLGSIEDMTRRPNGMLVGRMRVPIGVIFMIYEARPEVTVDAAALGVKAGNAVILRGGREARQTNQRMAELFTELDLPSGTVQVVTDPDRSLVIELLHAEGIDLTIPRGSEALIRVVTEHARMPVLRHFKGVCHLFVDEGADPAMATRIAVNAKSQRPSTCNALETLLVDRRMAETWLPDAVRTLRSAGVEVRGCPETMSLGLDTVPATEDDWGCEYLDLILSVRIVDGLGEAIEHIRRYSSGLADAIVTSHQGRAMQFVASVDSAAVLVNASTRLVDGEQFGLGAEIGISTGRIGPRGPMGARDLTTTKWIVLGTGEIRE